MTGVEIILILAGLVMMIGSFMVTEKLSGAELDRIAELSQNEIKKILENKLKDAEAAIEDQIDHAMKIPQIRWSGHWIKRPMKKCWQSVNIRIPLWKR